MGTISRKDRITRRGFLELSSAALATAVTLGTAKKWRNSSYVPSIKCTPVSVCSMVDLPGTFTILLAYKCRRTKNSVITGAVLFAARDRENVDRCAMDRRWDQP